MSNLAEVAGTVIEQIAVDEFVKACKDQGVRLPDIEPGRQRVTTGQETDTPLIQGVQEWFRARMDQLATQVLRQLRAPKVEVGGHAGDLDFGYTPLDRKIRVSHQALDARTVGEILGSCILNTVATSHSARNHFMETANSLFLEILGGDSRGIAQSLRRELGKVLFNDDQRDIETIVKSYKLEGQNLEKITRAFTFLSNASIEASGVIVFTTAPDPAFAKDLIKYLLKANKCSALVYPTGEGVEILAFHAADQAVNLEKFKVELNKVANPEDTGQAA